MGKTVRRSKQYFDDDYDPNYSPKVKRKRDQVKPLVVRKRVAEEKREIDDWVPTQEDR